MLLEGHPHEFVEYLHYVRGLAFDEKPNYNYLRGLLTKVLEKNGWTFDHEYDWIIKKRLLAEEQALGDDKKSRPSIIKKHAPNVLKNTQTSFNNTLKSSNDTNNPD
jgi:hypothetical protein